MYLMSFLPSPCKRSVLTLRKAIWITIYAYYLSVQRSITFSVHPFLCLTSQEKKPVEANIFLCHCHPHACIAATDFIFLI